MHSPPSIIASRGILHNKGNIPTLPTAGWLILKVEVRGGAPGPAPGIKLGYPEPKKEKKYYIKVTLMYKGEIYTDIKYVKDKVNVTTKDIDVEIVNDKPIVKIRFLE